MANTFVPTRPALLDSQPLQPLQPFNPTLLQTALATPNIELALQQLALADDISNIRDGEENNTLLHSALLNDTNNTIGLVRALAEKPGFPSTVNVKNSDGELPLHIACRHIFSGSALYLLAQTENLNEGDNNDQTPLHIACEAGNFQTMAALVVELRHQNLPIDSKNKQGLSPCELAQKEGHKKIVKYLTIIRPAIRSSFHLDLQLPLPKLQTIPAEPQQTSRSRSFSI